MAQLSESDAQGILKKVLGYSKADECEVTLAGSRQGNVRFARNSASTSGASDTVNLFVQSNFGKKTGVATINEFDDASLEKAVRRAEELARFSPENEELVPFLGPQQYSNPPAYVESTAQIDAELRAKSTAASATRMRQPPENSDKARACAASSKPRPDRMLAARAGAECASISTRRV